MNDSKHPDNLNTFVAGELDEVQNSAIIEHLSHCNTCLAVVDELWDNRPIDAPAIDVPELDTQTINRLEGRVVRQIQLSNFGGRAIWLGTAGVVDTYMKMLPSYVETCLAMLRPLLVLGTNLNFDEDKRND